MKTLYIVRHAKSSWEYDGIEDIDRPLKKRGINDAYLMSKVLNEEINRPDVFLSSSANRALHTSVIFCNRFKYPLSNLKINKWPAPAGACLGRNAFLPTQAAAC